MVVESGIEDPFILIMVGTHPSKGSFIRSFSSQVLTDIEGEIFVLDNRFCGIWRRGGFRTVGFT